MSEQQYLHLLNDVLTTGTKKLVYNQDKFLLSKIGCVLKFDLADGFPLLTHRYIYRKGAFAEMLWFIKGDSSIQYLHDHNVHIWDGWVTNGHVKLGYFHLNSQANWIIEELKRHPYRKHYLNSYWVAGEIYGQSEDPVALPPCHFAHRVYVHDSRLCLTVYIRSWDIVLGGPFNIAQYALLLHMYARCTGFTPGILTVLADDHHIYSDQIPMVQEILCRRTHDLPDLIWLKKGQKSLQDFELDDFEIVHYEYEPRIQIPLTIAGGYDSDCRD